MSQLAPETDPSKRPPTPGLLIVTGPSHSGKTTVAEALLEVVPPPAAFLSMDDILRSTLIVAPHDIWAQIPLGYELIRRQLGALLDRGWFVVVESTFTYVPASGGPELHRDALAAMTSEADDRGAPWLVVQLAAAAETIASRVAASSALPERVVQETVKLHHAELPGGLRLDSDGATPARLAQMILERLSAPPPNGRD